MSTIYLPLIDEHVPVQDRRGLVTSPPFTVPRELRPGFDPFQTDEWRIIDCPACAASPTENCLLCENTRLSWEEVTP